MTGTRVQEQVRLPSVGVPFAVPDGVLGAAVGGSDVSLAVRGGCLPKRGGVSDGLDWSRTRQWSVDPSTVGRARDLAGVALDDWGLLALSSDVRLCTSELVSNAIQHPFWDAAWGVCRSCVVTVTVWRSRRWLAVDVMDGDPSPLTLPPVPPALPDGASDRDVPSSGRGLWLVTQFADGLVSEPWCLGNGGASLWFGGGKLVRCWWDLEARGLAALPDGSGP